MEKSRLAYFSVFHPFRGGIAEFNELLFNELSHSFTVNKYQFKHQYPNILFPGKSQFIDEGQFQPNTSFSPINPLSFYQTARQINKSKPSVFLTAYWMPFFAPGLGTVSKRIDKNIKKVALLHNVVPHEKRAMDDGFNRYFLKQFDGFITLSETVSKQLLSYEPKAKHIQLYHPNYSQFGEKMDKEKARKLLKLPSDKTIILFFGIIREYKGLDWLLEAVDGIDNYHLIIAGESYVNFEKYDQLIDEKGIRENITRFDGFIENEKVRSIFSASNYTVLPYKSATQSGIAAIAKNFQLPMLVTPVGELPEEVIQNETGYVCPSADVKGIQEGLQSMQANHQRYQQKLLEQTKDQSWENFGKQATAFIQSL